MKTDSHPPTKNSSNPRNMETGFNRFFTLLFVVMFFLLSVPELDAEPLYGPVTNPTPDTGAVPPSTPPGTMAPGGLGGFGGPNETPSSGGGQNASPGSSGQGQGSLQNSPNGPTPSSLPNQPVGQPTQPNGFAPYGETSGQSASGAPTFMNGSMPNTTNPFLPSNISPGSVEAPLINSFLQDGVPQLAASMMSVVYQPFGMTILNPNPFQVTPQGNFSLTAMFSQNTNVNFSSNQPQQGAYYEIMPALSYSNFDDYGYISLLASASYYGFDTGNIAPYTDEALGLNTGTYLGNRVFVGVEDMGTYGSTPQMNGSPFGFFTGIQPYFYNISGGEVGIALTPKITFVESATDLYLDDISYGAGDMNLQSLTSTVNYQDGVNFLSFSYIYSQGLFSDFPPFVSDGITGTAMRAISKTTSLGIGGNASEYLFSQGTADDFLMYSYYGLITHYFNEQLSASFEGGLNVTQFGNGLSFPGPLLDLNVNYTGARGNLGLNIGDYEENMNSYGVEMGPEKTESVMGTFNYRLTPKTSYTAMAGYGQYQFINAFPYANNFFGTLQPNNSYNGTYIDITTGFNYVPTTWLTTGIYYNLMEFSSDIPNTTVVDNAVMAMFTFNVPFF